METQQKIIVLTGNGETNRKYFEIAAKHSGLDLEIEKTRKFTAPRENVPRIVAVDGDSFGEDSEFLREINDSRLLDVEHRVEELGRELVPFKLGREWYEFRKDNDLFWPVNFYFSKHLPGLGLLQTIMKLGKFNWIANYDYHEPDILPVILPLMEKCQKINGD